MFFKWEGEEKQGDFWIESTRLGRPQEQGFIASSTSVGGNGFCAAGVCVVFAGVLRREPGRTTWD
jgi:hypothetical protein